MLTDSPIRRSLLWLGAAWFKTPFVWLFLAWSIYLLFQRKRWAWINVAVGVGTVVAATAVSRHGDYTQGLGLANVSHAIKTAIPLFGWPGVVGLAAVVAIRPKLSTLAWRDPMAWVFLAGGALYLGNLLPWGQAGSYYGAPVICCFQSACCTCCCRLIGRTSPGVASSPRAQPWSPSPRPATSRRR